MAEVVTQSKGGVFSPEGVLMLGIFGILDIIDFFVASVLIVDILAVLFYAVWVHFRSQAISASEMQAKMTEIRKTKIEKHAARRKAPSVVKKKPLKGRWLRRTLFLLEWIPIIGMIPGWTLMVYSELKR